MEKSCKVKSGSGLGTRLGFTHCQLFWCKWSKTGGTPESVANFRAPNIKKAGYLMVPNGKVKKLKNTLLLPVIFSLSNVSYFLVCPCSMLVTHLPLRQFLFSLRSSINSSFQERKLRRGRPAWVCVRKQSSLCGDHPLPTDKHWTVCECVEHVDKVRWMGYECVACWWSTLNGLWVSRRRCRRHSAIQ